MIKDIALGALIVCFIILIFLIIISMIAGPIYIISNITIGLFLGKITYDQCMISIIVCCCAYVVLVSALNILGNNNG
jgi:hypothetical protein